MGEFADGKSKAASTRRDSSRVNETLRNSKMLRKKLERRLREVEKTLARAEEEHRRLWQEFREISKTKSVSRLSPEAEYRRRFPDSEPDIKLLRLVGMQPSLSLEEEKRELRGILEEKYGR